MYGIFAIIVFRETLYLTKAHRAEVALIASRTSRLFTPFLYIFLTAKAQFYFGQLAECFSYTFFAQFIWADVFIYNFLSTGRRPILPPPALCERLKVINVWKVPRSKPRRTWASKPHFEPKFSFWVVKANFYFVFIQMIHPKFTVVETYAPIRAAAHTRANKESVSGMASYFCVRYFFPLCMFILQKKGKIQKKIVIRGALSLSFLSLSRSSSAWVSIK